MAATSGEGKVAASGQDAAANPSHRPAGDRRARFREPETPKKKTTTKKATTKKTTGKK